MQGTNLIIQDSQKEQRPYKIKVLGRDFIVLPINNLILFDIQKNREFTRKIDVKTKLGELIKSSSDVWAKESSISVPFKYEELIDLRFIYN